MKQIQTNKIEWKKVEIGELLEAYKSGCWGEEGDEMEGIPVLRSTNFSKNLELKMEKIAYRKISQKDLSAKKLEFGDLLLEKSGGGPGQPVGRVIFFNIMGRKSYVCGNFIEILRLDKNKSYPKFIYYFLKKFYLSGGTNQMFNKTTGIQNIKLKEYLSIKIPLPFFNGKPDLKEQERIVKILEESEKLNERGKNADELLDEYLKSIFYEMFLKDKEKFKIKKLSDVVLPEKNSLKRGPFGGSLKKEIFVSEGFKVYEQQNAIYDDCVRGNYYITSNKFEEMKDFSVKSGDIIISCSGTIGKISILPKNCPKGIINQALLKISLDNKKVLHLFFKFFFESPIIQDKLFGFSHGSGIKNFPPMSNIRNLEIPLPPLPLQQKFAKIVEHVEKMKDSVNKTKRNSEELFNSLVSKGFGGEL
jgi:type I restriction enzyme S subunit